MFESEQDRANERAVIRECCAHWQCTARKLPCPPYKVDWLLEQQRKAYALAEVKCRGRAYNPYLIGLHKYEALTRLAKAAHLLAFIIVRWNERGLFFATVTADDHDGIQWMQDNRQREDADGEPCVALDIARFIAVTRVGGVSFSNGADERACGEAPFSARDSESEKSVLSCRAPSVEPPVKRYWMEQGKLGL